MNKPITVGSFTLVVYQRSDKTPLYCGRNHWGCIPHPITYGWLGNPHRISKDGSHPCITCHQIHLTAESTLEPYRQHLLGRLATDVDFATAFDAMLTTHKVLACYCLDEYCHTRIMAEVWEQRNTVATKEAAGAATRLSGNSNGRRWGTDAYHAHSC